MPQYQFYECFRKGFSLFLRFFHGFFLYFLTFRNMSNDISVTTEHVLTLMCYLHTKQVIELCRLHYHAYLLLGCVCITIIIEFQAKFKKMLDSLTDLFCTGYFFSETLTLTSINPKYDLVIWQKFYIFCFSTPICQENQNTTQLEDDATRETKNVGSLAIQDVILMVTLITLLRVLYFCHFGSTSFLVPIRPKNRYS